MTGHVKGNLPIPFFAAISAILFFTGSRESCKIDNVPEVLQPTAYDL